MSKQLQGPSSRMGTMVRRSTTAIQVGDFASPRTSSRSSTESLRLEANAADPEHVMPSPVAFSPAREAAESVPEPTGRSRLPSRPIVAPDPTPEPTATVSSSIPEPAPSGKEMAWLENNRLIELERQLSEMLVAQTERDQRIGELTDKLAQATEEKKHAGQELRKQQTKLDEPLLSRDHALEQAEANAAEEKRRVALELRKQQTKLDESLLSRDEAEANTAETKKRAGLEQCELQLKLYRSLLSRDEAEANVAEVKKRAGLEQRELQATLEELILSRDEHLRMPEQAQSALQEATSRATDADERSHPACEHKTELAELRAELEGKKSELAALRFRLTDAKDGWADKLHTVTAANLVDLNEDRTVCDLMEGGWASLKWSEKSMEDMDCGNEG